ncbi:MULTISPECIES: hypothetical protein [unclassified Legionella]|uniref:hypothetical protein n=1 Tax=unclassified Legionella TaxID=2622702 RepID=UPI001E2E8951|nr:hypothetical protein [Legionella sp. 31fI33]MCC5015021.1 hypothetical protein [Legionella sp. 31fI33]
MKVSNSKETQKDSRTRAIENNPCNMCRAFGLPICRGHGGGGGDGGSAGETQDNTQSMSGSPWPVSKPVTENEKLIQFLLESGMWALAEEADLELEFSNLDALLTIKLDMENGELLFEGKRDLPPGTLDELFDAVEQELALFSQELIDRKLINEPINAVRDREKNTLSIKIPSPQYYDIFIQRLLSKNILPNLPVPALEEKEDLQQTATKHSPEELASITRTTPTPLDLFDISRGPRPKIEA